MNRKQSENMTANGTNRRNGANGCTAPGGERKAQHTRECTLYVLNVRGRVGWYLDTLQTTLSLTTGIMICFGTNPTGKPFVPLVTKKNTMGIDGEDK